jgi:hypothetical protein
MMVEGMTDRNQASPARTFNSLAERTLQILRIPLVLGDPR